MYRNGSFHKYPHIILYMFWEWVGGRNFVLAYGMLVCRSTITFITCAHEHKISHLCRTCVTFLPLHCELIDLNLGRTLHALLCNTSIILHSSIQYTLMIIDYSLLWSLLVSSPGHMNTHLEFKHSGTNFFFLPMSKFANVCVNVNIVYIYISISYICNFLWRKFPVLRYEKCWSSSTKGFASVSGIKQNGI
jgi:hypothetical protein